MRPTAVLRRRALALALSAVWVPSSCGAQPAAGNNGDGAGAGGLDVSVPLPVDAPNVHSCGGLKQVAVAPAGGGRLQDRGLPCLTKGPAVNPARLVGRPVVVNLWATWCGPCREEMPLLQEVSRRDEGKVEFVGVNTRDRADWAAEYLGELGVTYPEVVDSQGELLTSLRSPGLPTTVVLDRQGNVAGRQIGKISEQKLTDLIDEVTR